MNKDQRTDAELNRIIAEWMGWTVWECHRGGYLLQYAYKTGSDPISGYRFDLREEAKKKHTQITWQAVDPRKWAGDLPDYCTDQNAIHKAELKLTDTELMQWGSIHARRSDGVEYRNDEPKAVRILFMPEARQRAEALVAVIESQKEPHA